MDTMGFSIGPSFQAIGSGDSYRLRHILVGPRFLLKGLFVILTASSVNKQLCGAVGRFTIQTQSWRYTDK